MLWRSEPQTFTLDAPGLASFQVKGGQLVQSVPAPGAGAAEVRLLAHGLPQAAIWVQRGYLALHAAAVSLPGGAVVLAGASGVGKSVLAAALVAAFADRGAEILADEVLPLEVRDGGVLPLAHPGDGDLLLWRAPLSSSAMTPGRCCPLEPAWSVTGCPHCRLPPRLSRWRPCICSVSTISRM